MRHIIGDSRRHTTLLPGTLDDCVGGDPPVRVIDAVVGILDVEALDFNRA